VRPTRRLIGTCGLLLSLAAWSGCGSGASDETASLARPGRCLDGQRRGGPDICVDATDPRAAEAVRVMRGVARRFDATGAVFGVWAGGKEIVSGAVGEALPQVPARRDQHFRIGNVTETMTTTLLLKYVDQGKVTLDDPVSTWYPSLQAADRVTLGMLGHSTSGYVDYVTQPSFVKALAADPFRQFEPDRLIRLGTSRPLLFEPGTRWAFSDTNFMLLGQILEKVGGQRLDRLLRAEVLGPLSLDQTTMASSADIPAPVLHGYDADTTGDFQDSTNWNISWATHTGYGISTLADMGRWTPALGSGELLQASSHRIQIGRQPNGVGVLNRTGTAHYGMGAIVLNGWILMNPGLVGYNGIIAYLPERRISMVIFMTAGRRTPAGASISSAAADPISALFAPDSPIAIPVYPRGRSGH
jgi:CubicO group peptidase (beta-lactamase class C family)